MHNVELCNPKVYQPWTQSSLEHRAPLPGHIWRLNSPGNFLPKPTNLPWAIYMCLQFPSPDVPSMAHTKFSSISGFTKKIKSILTPWFAWRNLAICPTDLSNYMYDNRQPTVRARSLSTAINPATVRENGSFDCLINNSNWNICNRYISKRLIISYHTTQQ